MQRKCVASRLFWGLALATPVPARWANGATLIPSHDGRAGSWNCGVDRQEPVPS